jgi:anti-sigma factor RsiW
MTEALEQVLRLVADGKLSAEEAAPILEALDAKDRAARDVNRAGAQIAFAAAQLDDADPSDTGRKPRYARVEVREHGRRVVDLRIPISLGRFALSRVPGLSTQQVAEVEEAVTSGTHGPILDVQDADGDGVRIVLE